jgi:sugar transferase (PEP-CTERM system associated)
MIRIFGYYISRIYLYLGLSEALVLAAALNLGVRTRFGWMLPEELDSETVAITSLVFALVMLVAMTAMGLYQRGVQEQEATFPVRIGIAFLLGASMLAVAFYLFPSIFIGRGVFGLSLLYALIGISITRAVFTRFASADARKRRVLVVGAGANAESLEALVRDDPGVGFAIAAYVPLADTNHRVPRDKLASEPRPLLDLAITYEADEIVVAADDRRNGLPVHDLLDCKMSGFEVHDLLSFFEKELALIRIDLLHPSWIFLSPGFHIGMTGLYGKRLFDVAVSLLMLVVAAPIMVLVALASLIESRGRDPVFYHQVRVGQNGRLFRLHKFRSMRVDAEVDGVAQWASRNDPRITRLGAFLRKTRLDELPQILNVLKGHMSLVGPRPERPEFVERLSASIPYYSERHRVKPGVTGWAQLLYPYGSTEEDAKRKLEFDLYYVKHAGIVLDLVILLQTVEVVLLGKGAR